MGILNPHIHALAMERTNHPIKGDVLTLGQQAVYSTLKDLVKVLAKYGIENHLPVDFDFSNKIPSWNDTESGNNTNAQAVLTLLGAKRVFACDVSDYENPDFIIDVNYQVNQDFKERFDVILDVGTLEHVFDISQALANINYMLKKGGELILILPSSNAIDHGFYSFSPVLFFDFCEENNYKNINCYLREGNPFNYTKKGKLYRYHRVGNEIPFISKKGVEILFFATKGDNTNSDKIAKPIQRIYKNKVEIAANIDQKKPLTKKIITKIKNITPQFLLDYRQRKKRSTNIEYIGNY